MRIAFIIAGLVAAFMGGRLSVSQEPVKTYRTQYEQWKETAKILNREANELRKANDSLEAIYREATRRADSSEKEAKEVTNQVRLIKPHGADSAVRILSKHR